MSEFSKLGLGGVDPTVNPKYYNDFDNELMLSTEETPSNDLMAKVVAPNSNSEMRALRKSLFQDMKMVGIKDPQMIDLMQQDLQDKLKKNGTPLSLPNKRL